jgi:hypothetical protein
MNEAGAASNDAGLVSAVRGLLEQFGVADARTLAEAVTLHRDHPRWAVWLPAAGGRWAAVRPVGLRPPGSELPMLWVRADTAEELGARMQQADTGLSPGHDR